VCLTVYVLSLAGCRTELLVAAAFALFFDVLDVLFFAYVRAFFSGLIAGVFYIFLIVVLGCRDSASWLCVMCDAAGESRVDGRKRRGMVCLASCYFILLQHP
jgi:hypothetical protein